MKTLIFNGSPRINGDAAILQKEFIKHLSGECKIVNAYDCNIKACTDCRYCWDHDGCSQIDDMQEVYSYIQECDNILIASPIFFTELTGPLLAVASRLQTYYCAKYLRKEIPVKKSKKGGVILVAGGAASMEKAFSTSKVILADMNAVFVVEPVYCTNTDKIPAGDNHQVMEEVKHLAILFNN